MSSESVPSAGELTAHVRTAVDASVRWLARAVETPAGDTEAWDHSTFYARVILMRGNERGELLGWVLERDALAAEGQERSTGLKQAIAYWQEARPDLHQALERLRRAADFSLADRAARDAVLAAREQLDQARSPLTDVAERLAVINRDIPVRESPTGLGIIPEPAYGLDRSCT